MSAYAGDARCWASSLLAVLACVGSVRTVAFCPSQSRVRSMRFAPARRFVPPSETPAEHVHTCDKSAAKKSRRGILASDRFKDRPRMMWSFFTFRALRAGSHNRERRTPCPFASLCCRRGSASWQNNHRRRRCWNWLSELSASPLARPDLANDPVGNPHRLDTVHDQTDDLQCSTAACHWALNHAEGIARKQGRPNLDPAPVRHAPLA